MEFVLKTSASNLGLKNFKCEVASV